MKQTGSHTSPEHLGVEHYRGPGGNWLALVVRASFTAAGIEFFTPAEFSQQFGFMKHAAGHEVIPHRHNVVERQVLRTQEVLFLRSGSCRVDLFSDDEVLVDSVILGPGDWILLAGGGHGLQMLDDCELFEIKQGPFVGDADKTRFGSN